MYIFWLVFLLMFWKVFLALFPVLCQISLILLLTDIIKNWRHVYIYTYFFWPVFFCQTSWRRLVLFPVLCQVQLQTSGSLTAVLGNNKYELTCTYSGLTSQQIQGLSLKLQKGGVNLISMPPLYLNKGTTIHSSVQNRVVVARFGASNPVTKVTFNSITCDEGGLYTWSATYYTDTAETTKTATQQITVKGKQVSIVLEIDYN